MEVQFAKWGNSVGLRVPAKVAEALGIAPGGIADLVVRKDQLIITPRSHVYHLKDLLDGIDSNNVHAEISAGESLGVEASD